MDTDQPNDGDGYSYTNEVFGNNLIFSLIAEYLEIPDLKILRQTSKLLLSQVNGNRKFWPGVQITISDESVEDNLMDGTLEWRNARVMISHTSAKQLPRIRTDCIEELELLLPPLSEKQSHWQKRSDFYQFLGSSKFTQLKSLTLDLNLLSYDIPMSSISGVVGTVKELRLTCIFRENFGELQKTAGYNQMFVRSLEMLCRLPWKLESILIGKLGTGIDWYSSDPLPSIGPILVSSASTLEVIKLLTFGFQDQTMSEVQGIVFPRLRSIGIRTRSELEFPITEFLRLQPQLESVEIELRQNRINLSMLAAIINLCSSKLHTLGLTGRRWFTSSPDPQTWTFLRDLSGLKDVVIHGAYNATGNMTNELLANLPPTIQSADIRHFRVQQGLEPGIVLALTGFPNIVHLKILDSPAILNDVALQSICRMLTRLRAFHFDSTELSDFGLTGERDGSNSGVSLRTLKGLRDLQIVNPGAISAEGLVKSIWFLELRVLLIGFTVPGPILVEIASNNPSLAFITRCVDRLSTAQDYRDLFANFLPKNPRLTKIRTAFETWKGWEYYDDDIGHLADRITHRHRPSYGVSTALSNEDTLSYIRKRMKIIKSTEFGPTCSYYYNI